MLLRRALASVAGAIARPAEPAEANAYLLAHALLLDGSLRRLTGRCILPAGAQAEDARRLAADGDIVVVSHGVELPEPVFNYANRAARELWELEWDAFVRLPSSRSAEPVARSERQRLLDEVRAHGFIADYTGVRVSATGKRFRISEAVVWDVRDEHGVLHGQACTFERARVEPLDSSCP
ncbi:hypothetical protein KFE25_011591 [Diacronema lutheri]|uniref:MEKHLA domain-containing protein n=2 Tax=Diacronema lutheri TaxID=2081491 RepID=A0A8J6C8Q7_DIALT|nr:hypothetical protein KFE25_011591 [Diacronema lutheri]